MAQYSLQSLWGNDVDSETPVLGPIPNRRELQDRRQVALETPMSPPVTPVFRLAPPSKLSRVVFDRLPDSQTLTELPLAINLEGEFSTHIYNTA